METIKIQYLNDEIERLRYIDGKSDWIDLRAAEEVELKAGEFKLIHLGVAMQLPEGYEAHIVPRSSTSRTSVLSRRTTAVSSMRATADRTTGSTCRRMPCATP